MDDRKIKIVPGSLDLDEFFTFAAELALDCAEKNNIARLGTMPPSSKYGDLSTITINNC